MPSLNLNAGEEFPTIFFMPITIFMWYIILGYEIKVWNEKREQSIGKVLGGLAIYFVSVGFIFFLSYNKEYLFAGTVTGMYYQYAFLPIVIATVGVVTAVTNINITRGKYVICLFGRTTFGIYLIHPVIYSIIWHLGIENLIPKIGLLGFLVLFILLTFLVSFAAVLLLQSLVKKCMNGK